MLTPWLDISIIIVWPLYRPGRACQWPESQAHLIASAMSFFDIDVIPVLHCQVPSRPRVAFDFPGHAKPIHGFVIDWLLASSMRKLPVTMNIITAQLKIKVSCSSDS